MPFSSEIKLSRLLDFENVTMISDPKALHSVQLPLWKSLMGGMLKRPEFQPCLDHFLGSWPDSDSHQTFLHPGVWVGNRDVSGQPDKIPAATMEGVANILLFERG